MKYRSKVVEIEAEEFVPERKPWPAGVEQGGIEGKNQYPTHYVMTEHGPAEILSGDFVITGLRGEKYPCRPETFHAKYEEAK